MRIVNVRACTVGIAHTYIAAEKLEQAAKKHGHTIQIENQGTIGAENELTDEEINSADVVLLPIDVKILNKERFEEKTTIEVPTDLARKSPTKLMEKVEEINKRKN